MLKKESLYAYRIADEQGTIQRGLVTILRSNSARYWKYVRTSRETVSRTLKLFQDQGFIDRNGRKLVIVVIKNLEGSLTFKCHLQ